MQGLKGYFPRGNGFGVDVTTRVIDGRRGGERNLGLNGDGNGVGELGNPREDELWPLPGFVRLITTVARKADMMSDHICQ